MATASNLHGMTIDELDKLIADATAVRDSKLAEQIATLEKNLAQLRAKQTGPEPAGKVRRSVPQFKYWIRAKQKGWTGRGGKKAEEAFRAHFEPGKDLKDYRVRPGNEAPERTDADRY
ncbi:hypothetical protein [Mesorhizobium sp. B2-3-4]|uniref:hypothetical protein n=1 Tax=Mesorhizobium sp. B2-3-4 TaxID=2589959 RepID=UPI00112D1AEA|nr:hypothetical protein [Mesorhizobium sp. B2-3-4]TPM41391.1 hypothetical protein FJ967_00190 [Mesorhizobium sp. B2-3-4]